MSSDAIQAAVAEMFAKYGRQAGAAVTSAFVSELGRFGEEAAIRALHKAPRVSPEGTAFPPSALFVAEIAKLEAKAIETSKKRADGRGRLLLNAKSETHRLDETNEGEKLARKFEAGGMAKASPAEKMAVILEILDTNRFL